FSDISSTLYKLKKYEEANIVNKECLPIAEEMKNIEAIFECKVREAKITFKTTKNSELQIAYSIKPLEKMLQDTKKEEQIATINYELSIMSHEIRQTKMMKKYKTEAIKLYKILYSKKPIINYLKNIDELYKL
ncbi:MAG: hypothetical protein K8S23_05780, partial [Candidatus Cloacimonetes bacterium]|nr:hypothetical protein [Candidatus Cloacimonadota bacterium]